jgi:hypothetical protein
MGLGYVGILIKVLALLRVIFEYFNPHKMTAFDMIKNPLSETLISLQGNARSIPILHYIYLTRLIYLDDCSISMILLWKSSLRERARER